MVIKRIDRRERGAQRRVISLRKANEREVRRYVTEN
jgi:uncharacterized DUF497 family protein